MKNIYGVTIPADAIPVQDVGDGVVFSMETCNHGKGKPPSPELLMESNKEEIADGGSLRTLDYWSFFGDNDSAPTLSEYFRGFDSADNIEYFDFKQAVEIARELDNNLAVANPPREGVYYEEVLKVFQDHGQAAALDLIGITPGGMLCVNPKLEKGENYKYFSIGLSLSPANLAGLGEMCPFRSWACTTMCLNDSGQGEKWDKAPFSAPQEFRKKRTLIFVKMQDEFWNLTVRATRNALKKVDKMDGFKLCVRMNVLSDKSWESIKVPEDSRNPETNKAHPNIMSAFKNVEYYDYSKNFDRFYKYLKGGAFPKNYSLTFSLSESNLAAALWVLKNGGNVAIPYDTTANKVNTELSRWHRLPPWWCGYRVIDGDISDMRFLDDVFFSDQDNVTDELVEKGSVTDEIVADVSQERLAGRGLIVGLRLKGTKNKANMRTLRKLEVENDFFFGELTGGFVQYADWAGMRDDRHYEESENRSLNPDFIRDAVLLSEARRLIQKSLSGVTGFHTQSFSAYAERGPMLASFVKSEFGITESMIRDMALKLSNNLVRADDILWEKSNYPPKRVRWTKEFVKFLQQKLRA